MADLWNITSIKEILHRHGFHFSKKLGQNFLINPSVCPKMAALCGADHTAGVLEIGAGIGVLTKELSGVAKKVVALELDEKLLPVLGETLKDCANVKVLHADVLKMDLPRLLADEFAGMDVVVCANLPYYITSPVLMLLLESRLPFSAVTVMVQKEAAERLCAKPGTRAVGAISIAVQYYAEPTMLFSVSCGSFLPPPKVDSCVIQLHIRKTPPVLVNDEKQFFAIVKAAFSQRRKTLLNALGNGLGCPKQNLLLKLNQLGIPQTARAEELSLSQFAELSNLF